MHIVPWMLQNVPTFRLKQLIWSLCRRREFNFDTRPLYRDLLRIACRAAAMSSAGLLTAGVVCLVLASPALAQEASDQEVPPYAFFDTGANTGGYAGVTLGESNLDIDAGELARSTSLVTKGRPFSFELVGGYRPLPFWSGELAYLRLGRASAGENYTQMEGYMLSALVYLPTPYINLYGRLGALDWHAYGRGSFAAGAPAPIPFHRRGLSTAYGVGGTTNGRGNLNLRLEWDKLDIRESRRADLVTVGIIWSII